MSYIDVQQNINLNTTTKGSTTAYANTFSVDNKEVISNSANGITITERGKTNSNFYSGERFINVADYYGWTLNSNGYYNNGSTVSTSINTLINTTVSNGDYKYVIFYFPAGKYYLGTSINLRENMTILGDDCSFEFITLSKGSASANSAKKLLCTTFEFDSTNGSYTNNYVLNRANNTVITYGIKIKNIHFLDKGAPPSSYMPSGATTFETYSTGVSSTYSKFIKTSVIGIKNTSTSLYYGIAGCEFDNLFFDGVYNCIQLYATAQSSSSSDPAQIGRIKINNIYADCAGTCIELYNVQDSCYISNIHIWLGHWDNYFFTYYVRNNRWGIQLHRADCVFINNMFIYGGWGAIYGDNGVWIQVNNLSTDICRHAIQIGDGITGLGYRNFINCSNFHIWPISGNSASGITSQLVSSGDQSPIPFIFGAESDVIMNNISVMGAISDWVYGTAANGTTKGFLRYYIDAHGSNSSTYLINNFFAFPKDDTETSVDSYYLIYNDNDNATNLTNAFDKFSNITIRYNTNIKKYTNNSDLVTSSISHSI